MAPFLCLHIAYQSLREVAVSVQIGAFGKKTDLQDLQK